MGRGLSLFLPLLIAPLAWVHLLLSRSQRDGYHGRPAPGKATAALGGVVLYYVAAIALVHLRARIWLGLGLYLDIGRHVVGDGFVRGARVGGLGQGREAEHEECRLE